MKRLNSHNLSHPGRLPKHDLSASLKDCKTSNFLMAVVVVVVVVAAIVVLLVVVVVAA